MLDVIVEILVCHRRIGWLFQVFILYMLTCGVKRGCKAIHANMICFKLLHRTLMNCIMENCIMATMIQCFNFQTSQKLYLHFLHCFHVQPTLFQFYGKSAEMMSQHFESLVQQIPLQGERKHPTNVIWMQISSECGYGIMPATSEFHTGVLGVEQRIILQNKLWKDELIEKVVRLHKPVLFFIFFCFLYTSQINHLTLLLRSLYHF